MKCVSFGACALMTIIACCGLAHAKSATSDDDAMRIQDGLGLRGFSRQTVVLHPDPILPGRVIVETDLGSGPTRLLMDPHSVRATGFQVIIHDDSGASSAAPPACTTYRGIDATTGAIVAASIIEGRVSAAIRPENGEAIFIQPTADAIPGAPATDAVIYTMSQVRGGSWVCAAAPACPDCGATTLLRGGGTAAACLRTAEILFDADYPFFQAHTSAATTVSDIENIVNQCDIIYRRDVGVSWTIRQVTIRATAATDPYNDLGLSSIDPGTILGRVGTVWSAAPSPSRDLVHLMTGRDLSGGTIGIAWVGVVCRSSNTGVSQSLFTSNLAMRTSLTAHEVGHNFNAQHDTSGDFIMGPSVSPADQLVFSPTSIAAMTAYVNSSSASCMTAAGPTAVPDSAATSAGHSVLIDVLANDVSGCGNALSISLPVSTSTAGGALAISTGTGPGGRNQIRYTPPASVPAAGINDSFTYRITEASTNGVATGSVGVNVTGGVAPPCPADFNGSGTVSVQDVFDFLAAYFAGDPRANVNGVNGITSQDLFDFLTRYFTTCP